MPQVSVIIPTHNRAGMVQDAIESALAQTFRDFEIIVVDDGSTDETREVLEKYKDRIHYFYQVNQGAAAARNNAIAASRGELIALLDSDDIWMPTKLAVQIEFLRTHSAFALVACHAIPIDEQARPSGDTPVYPFQPEGRVAIQDILLHSPLVASSIIVKREFLPTPLAFTPSIKFCEDWEMCLRVAITKPVGFIAQALVGFRQHTNNLTHPLGSQEQIDLHLKNRLCVVERIFPLLTENLEYLQPLRARVEAADYIRAALASYANRNFAPAAERLAKAIRGDPQSWQGPKFAWLLENYAGFILEKNGEAAAFLFLQNIFSHLPPEFGNAKSLRRRTFAALRIAIVFRNYRHGERNCILGHALRAIFSEPAWLLNRGVISILIETILGTAITQSLRQISHQHFKAPSYVPYK